MFCLVCLNLEILLETHVCLLSRFFSFGGKHYSYFINFSTEFPSHLMVDSMREEKVVVPLFFGLFLCLLILSGSLTHSAVCWEMEVNFHGRLCQDLSLKVDKSVHIWFSQQMNSHFFNDQTHIIALGACVELLYSLPPIYDKIDHASSIPRVYVLHSPADPLHKFLSSPTLLPFLISLWVWDTFLKDLLTVICLLLQCNNWECSISSIA